MLRTRLKSTLAAVATASPSLRGIPVAPELGFGPLRCSFAHFAPKNGFRFLFERLHALHACLGPIFRVRFLPFQSYAVSISDPDAVAQIYRHEGAMPQRQLFAFWKLYRDERQWPLGLTNTNEYAEWKKFRLGMSAHLLQPHNVQSWLPRLDAVARDVAARIQSQARASPSGDVPMTLTTKAFTLEAVSSIVFGKRMGCLSPNPSTPVSAPAQAFIRAVDGFFETTQQLMAIPPDAPRIVRTWASDVDFIFRLGHDMVREKIACREPRAESDLLTLFLQRPELSERDAVAQALDVLFAGVDTTSTALLWALYCLTTSPKSREIQAKMRAEVESALDGAAEFDAMSFEKLSYIRAVVKETLRLYPVATPNQRYLSQDMTLLGHDLPRGTNVLMATYSMSRNPSVFDEPESFVPDRWLERGRKLPQSRKQEAYSTLPFGFGARSCAGRRLAETKMYLFLAHVVRRVEIQWAPDETHPHAILQTMLMPDKPLTFRFQPWTS
ncbi:hypothetical protein SPRG_14730 [Saprolegnia parasitica CBS 223.65]|uniref:Cytochrome P450 n=1 Tax=Saprolegnia parasitica (strain CBS 223.65) TaxID=695850 RepID=A0A067BZ88_SAPPC|nr:hypothetical protein SPRG_14730 [Saprolegnia parasitica CBS 223.65]KDO19887.1 hypothetical protein SPRG_14730 [Saprolegnia parasitica CBS 223.65]|eukprot:XP_012209389.1 hypothetical protein SPRG_14730 [Saprolegnia parasitica CBS 223.65]